MALSEIIALSTQAHWIVDRKNLNTDASPLRCFLITYGDIGILLS